MNRKKKTLKGDFTHQSHTYSKFKQINGRHGLKEKVPDSYLEYRARPREKGRVLYFNFTLAKEMGLIPETHPEQLNSALKSAILDTFSLIIINEYDIKHRPHLVKTAFPDRSYMATRYLQLQHPGRTGKTSGDGRSLWNGEFKGKKGSSWDIMSCGTGATILSPAHAKSGKYYKTGDPTISYGCGLSEQEEGISQAVMSEILNDQGVSTERTLAVLSYRGGFSINVRAGKNLFRPSHLFVHLKQSNYDQLKAMTDLIIQRKDQNRAWTAAAGFPQIFKGVDFVSTSPKAYDLFLHQLIYDFARTVAQMDRNYIFCWYDWDGDNCLLDGGIIDYGSVRQFGLYHHEYRYDDDDRFSTTIKDQKHKARYILQNFIQLVEYLKSKKKKNINDYSQHRLLKLYDLLFEEHRLYILAMQMGFKAKDAKLIIAHRKSLLVDFFESFKYFERTKSERGPKKVADGLTHDAVFCMRDLLIVLPKYFHEHDFQKIESNEFIQIIKSDYAVKKDLVLSSYRLKKIEQLQEDYKSLIKWVAKASKVTEHNLLKGLEKRTQKIYRSIRPTGNSLILITEELIKTSKNLSEDSFNSLLHYFISHKIDPYKWTENLKGSRQFREVADTIEKLEKIILSNRHSI